MLSEKQLEANRANAQKSTGPKSEAGKQRSRLNAFKHGLSSQVFIMPEEEVEEFNQFAQEIVDSFAPVGATELQLAESFASYQWRINKAAAIENNMLTLGVMEEVAENLNIPDARAHNAATYAKTFRQCADEFSRLSMYAQRLVSQSDKVMQQLLHLQVQRKRRIEAEKPQAAEIYVAHRMQNAAFDPQEHGFVLTVPEIEAYIHRLNLKNPQVIAEMARHQQAKAA
jgi:hypothetical protein